MSELDNLRSQQSAYTNQKRGYEASRAEIKEKIERLKEAKRLVTNVKDNQVEADKAYIAGKLGVHADTWAGKNYNDVQDIHQTEINVRYENYYNDVDYILDMICDEITGLENENRNLGYLLNSVINALNNIANEIEKWLN